MVLLIIIIIAIIILILLKGTKNESSKNNKIAENIAINNSQENNLKEEHSTNYIKYYKPKIYITTLNEMKFYNVLLEIAKELDYILFSQVSLYNIVSMKENLDYSTHTKYFNKIASKSIDFVLVDKKCRIKLCIELDDTTHRKKNRIERDKFINDLFEELEIDLLRYPVYNVYYKDTLKKKIQESIKEHYYTSEIN